MITQNPELSTQKPLYFLSFFTNHLPTANDKPNNTTKKRIATQVGY